MLVYIRMRICIYAYVCTVSVMVTGLLLSMPMRAYTSACRCMHACACRAYIYTSAYVNERECMAGMRVSAVIYSLFPLCIPFGVVLQVDHIIGSSSKETEEWAWMIMIRSVICCQLTRLSSYSRYCIARSRYVHFPVNPKHILSNNNLSSLNRVILALFQVQNMFERTYSSPTLSTQSCTKPYACICVSLPSHMVLSFLYSWKYDN